MRIFLLLLTTARLFAQEQPVLLKASTVLDGRGGARHNLTLLVDGATIRTIGAPAQVRGVVYNLTGLTLMPGLIDTHVHLASHFGPNGKVAPGRGESPATEMGYALENAYLDLMAGVTTVQSVGSPIDRDVREAINRGVLPGPRVLTSVRQITDTRLTPDQLRELVRQTKADGADLIKLFASKNFRDGGAQTMSDEQILAVCREARAQGMRVLVHVYSSHAIMSVSQAGCTSVEHGTLVDDEALRFLAAHGTYFDPNIGVVAQNYVINKDKFIGTGGLPALLMAAPLSAQSSGSEVTKWQDGKDACVSITFDDASINQFRVGIPLLNERGLPGTFFIITGDIEGSRYQPAFIGRPIIDILRESGNTPTSKENMLERAAMLNYLSSVLHVPELKGFRAQSLQRPITRGDLTAFAAIVDPLLAKLRQSGAAYSNGPLKTGPPLREAGDTSADWPGDQRYHLTWDELRRHMAEGHEMANHTITHALLPVMNEANIAYELDQSKKEMLEQLGPKSQFSVEAPFGIDDPRVKDAVASRFPITRNWVLDDFMTGILRGGGTDPTTSTKEYVQWQRGPLAATPLADMKGWVDTSLDHGIWLVLVIHGIEGIGWEALTTGNLRNYFDYIAERKRRLWVATYQDAAKYARERHASTVAAKAGGDRIEVTVTHSLDKKLYDLPLTVKTPLPADWKLAHFQQGTDARWLPVHHEGDSAFVLYQVAPNGPPAVVEKAAN